MAFSAHQDPDQVKEHFSEKAVVDSQAKEIANAIRKAKHVVAFTGAGVSTSAGISDFRGPNGVWTLRAQGKNPTRGVSTVKAIPTATHMALVSLQKAGYLQFLVSQNCDGLHRRSGFPPESLAELHGNSNLERCNSCGKEYLRDFSVRRHSNSVHEHETGRFCSQCKGTLSDTIINFGENLPSGPLKNGFKNSKAADFYLVLGSSLTVTPAADMPRKAANNGAKLAICNLQKTPLDSLSTVRVFAPTDELMIKVCNYLEVPISQWLLKRWIMVKPVSSSAESVRISIQSVDSDKTPTTVLSNINVTANDKKLDVAMDANSVKLSSCFSIRVPRLPVKITINMEFMGHYQEPQTTIDVPVNQQDESKLVILEFNPRDGNWNKSIHSSQ